MVKFTFNTTLNLNIPWCDCYGWVSGQGVHFILNSTTIASFWKTGEIDRNDLDVEDADTILEVIEHSGVCAADDVIKILYTDEDFLIEV